MLVEEKMRKIFFFQCTLYLIQIAFGFYFMRDQGLPVQKQCSYNGQQNPCKRDIKKL